MRRSVASHISGERLWSRIQALAAFGARADGGVDRPALSNAEIEARAQLVAWGRAIGLTPFTDDIGNLFLRLDGRDRSLAPALAGSHIDSQPTGGRFDGVFGVLAAFEAVEAMIDAGHRPVRSIEIVAWMNEEGSRFAPGMNGSTAFCFPEKLPAILSIRDTAGIGVGEAVAALLAQDVDVGHRPLGWKPALYIEPHIEQGPILERESVPIGVVTGIQGTRRYRVRVTGKEAHAGTEPMKDRKDALLTAVEMISRLSSHVASDPDLKFTVGMFEVKPNAPSVVPGEVYFSIDIRHPEDAVVDRVDREIRRLGDGPAGACSIAVQQIAHAPSIAFSQAIQTQLATAADTVRARHMPVFSAAGHDARQLNAICPTGMIFIPCRDGLSHNVLEWSEPEHVTLGAKVLAELLEHLR